MGESETNAEDEATDDRAGGHGVGAKILVAMVLGLAWGMIARTYLGGEIYVGILGFVFKAMLMMLIVPLVFASIVTGITSLGDIRELGRIGKRTVLFYLSTTLIAVVLGLTLVNTIRPGKGGGADALQVSLEVSQGKDRKLLALAAAESESGRFESARAMYEIYLERYTHDEEARIEARRERDSLQAPPDYRVRQRRVEAETRWKAEIRGATAAGMTVREFLKAQVEKVFRNPFSALANAEVLAIIVFALLLGGCLTTLGEVGRPLIQVFEALNAAMMVLTDLVMRFAPYGVFALIADVVAAMGVAALQSLGLYMLTVIAGLAIHGFVVLPVILRAFGGMGFGEFFRGARPAVAIAFSTASSSATLPVSIEVAEENLGCDTKHAGFVLPLGATVNMDGTALYEAVAALFIAQIYGIELGLTQQLMVALTATLAAIGAAGIPSAGTVTMVMVLNAVNLPVDGIALILAVDRALDMCRTAVNNMGDLVGAVVIDRLEKADASAS